MRPLDDTNDPRSAEITEKLFEAETKIELAQQLTGVGFWEWYIPTDAITYDATLMAMLGYEKKQKTCTHAFVNSIHRPDDLESILYHINKHLKGDAPIYSHRHQAKTASGDWIWVHAEGKVISWDEQGKPLRLVGSVMDISQQVRLENFFYSHQLEKLKKELSKEDALRELHSAAELTNENIITICSGCKKIQEDTNRWMPIELFIRQTTGMECSHGICMDCMQKIYGDEDWFQKIYEKMFPSSPDN